MKRRPIAIVIIPYFCNVLIIYEISVKNAWDKKGVSWVGWHCIGGIWVDDM